MWQRSFIGHLINQFLLLCAFTLLPSSSSLQANQTSHETILPTMHIESSSFSKTKKGYKFCHSNSNLAIFQYKVIHALFTHWCGIGGTRCWGSLTNHILLSQTTIWCTQIWPKSHQTSLSLNQAESRSPTVGDKPTTKNRLSHAIIARELVYNLGVIFALGVLYRKELIQFHDKHRLWDTGPPLLISWKNPCFKQVSSPTLQH